MAHHTADESSITPKKNPPGFNRAAALAKKVLAVSRLSKNRCRPPKQATWLKYNPSSSELVSILSWTAYEPQYRTSLEYPEGIELDKSCRERLLLLHPSFSCFLQQLLTGIDACVIADACPRPLAHIESLPAAQLAYSLLCVDYLRNEHCLDPFLVYLCLPSRRTCWWRLSCLPLHRHSTPTSFLCVVFPSSQSLTKI